ncbi:MAG: hypothetical protein K8R73_12105 [Clostridiales bacterium]|nr:hypothetical protein [Clostridiales bacterium]
METLNVVLKLNEIICHDEGDGWGSAEPYLWAIFFKIDGLSVWQNGVMLGGEADFKFSHGSHNNLPNHDVDPGEVVQIPAPVGEWSTILKPIEIDDFQGNIIEVPGIVGAVAVLMEEDNVSDDGAEAGHQGLNNHVRDSINNFISSINLLDFVSSDDPAEDLQQKIDDLIKSIKDNIESVVKDAITSNQNWLEDLWAWVNKDDKIGDVVWTYNSTEIIENSYNISLNERWDNEGDWEIDGEISASELCPTNAVNNLSVRDLNQKLDLSKLRTFRDTLYKEFPLATNWWIIALKNSPFIIRELQKNKNLCNDVFQIIKNIEASIDSKDRFNEGFFDDISMVLEKFGKSNFKSLRMDSRRLKPIIKDLRGKNLNEILDHLSSCKPLVQVKQ